jgi:hypothetical protein
MNTAPEPGRDGWSVRTVRALLARRSVAAGVLGGAIAYFLALAALGGSLDFCAFRQLTGLPCPGCGLSRAIVALAHGEGRSMLRLHPFAPYLIVWAVMLAGAALLPSRGRARWLAGWLAVESRTRFHGIMLAALAVYGVARLVVRVAHP